MSFFRNQRLGKRLGFSFSALLFILLLLGLFGIVQKTKINFYAQDLGHRWLPSLRVIGEINDAFNQSRRTSLRYYLTDDSSARATLLNARDEIIKITIPDLFTKYETLITSHEADGKMKEVKRLWSTYLETDKQLIELANKGESSAMQAKALAAGETATSYVAAINALNAVSAWSNTQGQIVAAAASVEYEQGIYISIAVIVCALGLGVLMARVITNSITKPLKQGILIAETVASGNLTLQIDATGKDEVADLLRAMQKMSKDLSTVVANVRTCSVSIAHGSHEIAIGNADLSQRTEEQASNLEETASSMEQFTSTAQSNSDIARQANKLSISATEAASKGGTVFEQVVQTMAKIQADSQKISDITGLIDVLAFQTNILALNAAVEAARAGAQGRGFAVVATEVRNLAQKSANAAKEIKALIDDSVITVEMGSKQANLAGESMKNIVDQIQNVGLLISSISNATSEQTSGITQVSNAISQLDQVTQQNAALVEESAAAADSLKGQADQLAKIVSTFKINETPNDDVSIAHSSSLILESPSLRPESGRTMVDPQHTDV